MEKQSSTHWCSKVLFLALSLPTRFRACFENGHLRRYSCAPVPVAPCNWPFSKHALSLIGRLSTLTTLSVLLALTGASGCKISLKKAKNKDLGNPHLFYQLEEGSVQEKLQAPFFVGTGAASVAPDQPTSIAGFAGFPRRLLMPRLQASNGNYYFFAPFRRVDLEPRIKVLVLGGQDARQERGYIVTLSLDMVFVPADLSKKLLTIVKEFAQGRDHKILHTSIAATHTHASVGGFSEHPLWQAAVSDRFSPSTVATVEKALVSSLEEAFKKAGPVTTLAIRQGDVEGFTKVRWPGTLLFKESMQLQFRGDSSSPELRACVTTFPVHPIWFGSQDFVLSSDISGHIEKSFATSLGSDCFFFNGAEGNISPITSSSIEDYADRFASAVAQHQERTEPLHKVVAGSFMVSLPEPRLNKAGCEIGKAMEALIDVDIFSSLPRVSKVSYMLINNILWLMIPGEPLANLQQEWEEALKKELPTIKQVRLLSTSNDYIGYIVPAHLYAQAHIESCSSYYGSDLADLLLAQISANLSNL